MTTYTPFSLSCTPQSRLLFKHKLHSSPSPTTSLLSPQVGQKSLCRPLMYNGVSPTVINRKRINVGVPVKASMDNKNMEVLTKENLAVSLAKYVYDLSNKFIGERGFFTIALSSGSVKYLKKLAEPPYLKSIDWSKWHVFLVDERIVPRTHLESNYKLVYDGFISKVPIPPRNVNTIVEGISAEGAADGYESTLKFLVASNVIASSSKGFPKFDLMLLDVGPDGHVASLFPGDPAVDETKKWVTVIKNAPTQPPERVTLTFPVINASSNIAMLVTGAGKADVVYTALGEEAQSSYKLPVQLVSPQGELKWFLDKGAASKLYK